MGAGGSTMDFDPEKERIAEQLREESWRVYYLAQAEKKEKEGQIRLRALAKLTEEEKKVLGLYKK